MINDKASALKPVPDKQALQEGLAKNPYLDRFVKEGTKLLENTNRPNIITVDQFAPYLALYKVDQQKYDNDAEYRRYIAYLYQQFRVNLSINLHEPILVIRSVDDQTVEYHLDRVFTRIRPDAVAEGHSEKNKLSTIGPRTPKERRVDMVVGAMLMDVTRANETPEQLNRFRQMRQESALITKRFVEQNLSPDKRDDMMKDIAAANTPIPDDHAPSIVFDDDD